MVWWGWLRYYYVFPQPWFLWIEVWLHLDNCVIFGNGGLIFVVETLRYRALWSSLAILHLLFISIYYPDMAMSTLVNIIIILLQQAGSELGQAQVSSCWVYLTSLGSIKVWRNDSIDMLIYKWTNKLPGDYQFNR